jgi:hypothetical protein
MQRRSGATAAQPTAGRSLTGCEALNSAPWNIFLLNLFCICADDDRTISDCATVQCDVAEACSTAESATAAAAARPTWPSCSGAAAAERQYQRRRHSRSAGGRPESESPPDGPDTVAAAPAIAESTLLFFMPGHCWRLAAVPSSRSAALSLVQY